MENTVISIDCDGIAKIPNHVATDNCDPIPTVTMTTSMSEGNCPNEWTEVYVWVATDSFGNSSNVSFTVHYTDTIAPVFTFVPATMEVACGADIPASTAEASDNCGIVSVTSSDGNLQTGDCEDHYIRTFTAVDECGNSSTATQRINIIDTVPPVFTQTIADIVVECAADAPAIAVASATDNCGSVDIQSESILLSSDSCGNYVEQVTYTAMDACGNIATQSYTITVLDTTAPVLSETPDSLILDCLDSLPVAPVITASDICQDSISVNYSEQFFGDAPTPGSSADCNLSTAPNTNPSWSLWLQDLPAGYNYYITEGAKLVEFPDGTAHLTGTVVSASNPDAGWIIDVWYMDGKNWDDWSGQDAQSGFKDDAGLAGNNYLDWTFYITNGDSSTLTGTGDLAGSFLNLQHEPASRFYAFQVGVAANNFSAGYGMGGWFHYEGTFQNSALPSHEDGVIENGVGDFAFEGDCCPIYNVHRTWTATDCAGNSTSWTQNISFTDLSETAAFVEIPETPNFNIPRNFMAISNIYPNPSRGLTTVEFISQFDMPVTLEIYNVVDKNTARLFAGAAKAGLVNKVDFDGSDMHSGIYFIRLISGTEIFLEKFIIQQ